MRERLARAALLVAVFAAPRASALQADAPAGPGQASIAVGFDANGALRAALCAKAPCVLAGGSEIPLPPEAQALRAGAKLAVARLKGHRHAVLVRIPDAKDARAFEVLVAAPLGGSAKPALVFSDWTGFVDGEPGERTGHRIEIRKGSGGEHTVLVGELQENATLCGRPTLLHPKALNPETLALAPTKLQRLGGREQETAPRLVATRAAEGTTGAAGPGFLRASVASSAVGDPAALTDGNPVTAWAEKKGGDGRGEFAVLLAPPEVPLSAFDFVVRPPSSALEHGASPKSLWLATQKELFFVTVPEDAWKQPGVHYRVTLPAPVRTDCVSVILETAYAAGDVDVGLAEIAAIPAFDTTNLPELAKSLMGGDAQAEAAGAVLRQSGPPGFAAVVHVYPDLDEPGRRVALDVMDHAGCEAAAPIYIDALLGDSEGQQIHAQDRLRRCGDVAAPALVSALERATNEQKAVLGRELALAAPSVAVATLSRLLRDGDPETRRLHRISFALAADSERAREAVRALLRGGSHSEIADVDVLRALGPRLPGFLPESTAAFSRLATPKASFRTRYLLLEPAAELAARDSSARAYLRRALVLDPSPALRARAAELVEDPTALRDEMLRAVADENVRVRVASVKRLGEARSEFSSAALARRLDADPWPMVRAAAATSLGALGPSTSTDDALFGAVSDESPIVQVPALYALGVRGARRFAPEIRKRLENRELLGEVRAAAALSLGALCDSESVGALVDLARTLKNPFLEADQQLVARASLAAVGRIHPKDLSARLAPLLADGVPTGIRDAARAMVAAPGKCGGK